MQLSHVPYDHNMLVSCLWMRMELLYAALVVVAFAMVALAIHFDRRALLYSFAYLVCSFGARQLYLHALSTRTCTCDQSNPLYLLFCTLVVLLHRALSPGAVGCASLRGQVARPSLTISVEYRNDCTLGSGTTSDTGIDTGIIRIHPFSA